MDAILTKEKFQLQLPIRALLAEIIISLVIVYQHVLMVHTKLPKKVVCFAQKSVLHVMVLWRINVCLVKYLNYLSVV